MKKIKYASSLAVISIILALFAVFLVRGALITSKAMSSTGSVTAINLGVYSDHACTVNCTSINWGLVAPGSAVDQTVYVENTGNSNETLSLTPSNYIPSGSSAFLSVSWNLQNSVLAPSQISAATLTLSVSPNVTGITNFSIELTLSGTG